jgi:hypothetical protein
MVELYLYSPICFHGIVLKYLSTGTVLPIFILISFDEHLVISTLLFINISLSTLFSNALIQCSFLNMRERLSHTSRNIGKIRVLYISVLMFLDSKCEDKSFLA